jgi:hypothetical protein
MAAASFEVVNLLHTNAFLPRTCVRCGAENPTKQYDTKAKALLGTEHVFGGRKETWATYSLKPWLCESCHRQTFRAATLLSIVGGALIMVGIVVVLWLGIGPLSESPGFSAGWIFLGVVPTMAGLLLLISVVVLRPPMPLALETKAGSVRLVFVNQTVAGEFVAANQGSCGDVFTRTTKPREWALYAILASILGLVVLEVIQIPSWIQGVENPEGLPMILAIFGPMIASGLIAVLAAVVLSRKSPSVMQAKTLALFGGLFSILWLLFLDLAINSSRTFSMNPLAVILGIIVVAAVYFSFETSERIAQPPPP